jgi:hypothetical protein
MSKRFAGPAEQLTIIENIPIDNELTIRDLLMVQSWWDMGSLKAWRHDGGYV